MLPFGTGACPLAHQVTRSNQLIPCGRWVWAAQSEIYPTVCSAQTMPSMSSTSVQWPPPPKFIALPILITLIALAATASQAKPKQSVLFFQVWTVTNNLFHCYFCDTHIHTYMYMFCFRVRVYGITVTQSPSIHSRTTAWCPLPLTHCNSSTLSSTRRTVLSMHKLF